LDKIAVQTCAELVFSKTPAFLLRALSIHCSSNKTRVAKLPHGMVFFCFWRQFWVCGAQAFADLQDREATQIEDCGMGDNLHKIHGTQHTLE
tara:strand:- start:64 stop:339 length:276 start_codon:yes stop_codon:yes gene_type:complete